MPKCPKCHSEISYLNAYSLEENKQSVGLDPEKEFLDYEVSETVDGTCQKMDFVCPECNEVLFTNNGDCEDDRVIKFLKGEQKKKGFVFR
jgi:hypothetical protein